MGAGPARRPAAWPFFFISFSLLPIRDPKHTINYYMCTRHIQNIYIYIYIYIYIILKSERSTHRDS
jgi:hypothetical protein